MRQHSGPCKGGVLAEANCPLRLLAFLGRFHNRKLLVRPVAGGIESHVRKDGGERILPFRLACAVFPILVEQILIGKDACGIQAAETHMLRD